MFPPPSSLRHLLPSLGAVWRHASLESFSGGVLSVGLFLKRHNLIEFSVFLLIVAVFFGLSFEFNQPIEIISL